MKKPLLKVALVLGTLLAVLVVVSLVSRGGTEPTGAGAATAWAYMEHLRAGREERAEALWTRLHRDSTAPADASRVVGPLLKASDFVKFVSSLTTSERACHFGGIGRSGALFDDIDHSIRIFLVRDGGGWKIDAVQTYPSGNAPVPPWPENWHPRARQSSCGSGYR